METGTGNVGRWINPSEAICILRRELGVSYSLFPTVSSELMLQRTVLKQDRNVNRSLLSILLEFHWSWILQRKAVQSYMFRPFWLVSRCEIK